jgi:hypothetical protein
MAGKILLILGILGIMLGGLVTIISLILPQMTPNVSMSEATVGIAAGIIILAFSFLPAILGVIIMILKKKKTA